MKIRTSYFAVVINGETFRLCPDHVREVKQMASGMVRSIGKACDLCHVEVWSCQQQVKK